MTITRPPSPARTPQRRRSSSPARRRTARSAAAREPEDDHHRLAPDPVASSPPSGWSSMNTNKRRGHDPRRRRRGRTRRCWREISACRWCRRRRRACPRRSAPSPATPRADARGTATAPLDVLRRPWRVEARVSVRRRRMKNTTTASTAPTPNAIRQPHALEPRLAQQRLQHQQQAPARAIARRSA